MTGSSLQARLHYLIGDANQPDFYPHLKARRSQELQKQGASANILFYVSTPASLAPPIVEGLGESGLNRSAGGWTRIVLEKPFGHDLQSAQELNEIVSHVFHEQSIYRIDHYLGKETVQNIMVFRFGNSMFEPIWNRNYIDYIEITAAETLGVESRAAFYEETGALRDMVANHLCNLLTLTAMEPPVAFDADSVREQKVQVLRAIRPMSVDEVAQAHHSRTVRARHDRRQAGSRLSPGARGQSKFAHRNLRRGGVSRRQLALGGSSLLRSHRQTTGQSASPRSRCTSSARRRRCSPAVRATSITT